ncbi:transglutaminase-like domain-containing protein [Alkaliphilus serpentinus]|uniref:Transglutaminase domain-containing protein n=1 Tax=Alkaliphilus serpentinus TaxID=1482731 RepID=A0A833HRF7_9FIRM|nr:transglutaminase-like domain-containing protein [Alkaliphilus serpentinus]KAB3531841.1 transglutaminase domain-containing protein [Alkaliphilus serpentinus]
MRKSRVLSLIIIMITLLTFNVFSYGGNSDIYLVEDDLKVGLIGVYNNSNNQNRLKLLIEKDGERYTYNIFNEDEIQQFPLQMGNGSYTIKIMENTEGNKYRSLSTKKVQLQLEDYKAVFLNSIQEINWDQSNEAIKLAEELTEGKTTDQEKVETIYTYIIENISYDYKKIETLTPLYLPNIDSTLEDGQGICYDYSALMAAMLRSVGVPTKMVKGYTTEIPGEYHAWNEVLVEGEWKVMDTTFDAAYYQSNREVSQYKDSNTYSAQKFF